MKTLRANLLLTALTLVVCCVLYPAVLYTVARVAFPADADGSLTGAAGAPSGSRLIAQPFTGDEYFWPRPSAASYNAAVSGGSNWGANNPKLRDRACRQLGPIVLYKAGSRSAVRGRTPQQDVEAWFAAKPELAAVPHEAGVPASFFDSWLCDPANADKATDLEPVPADFVTASGSGLDPHVTLRNALSVYQLDRVARKRGSPPAEIAELVRAKAFTPLSGLAGEPLVNVLELNTELDAKFPAHAR